ncbi:MAG: hypothetical protein AB1505_05380 [Candidatus Latescibacterota bacterium]
MAALAVAVLVGTPAVWAAEGAELTRLVDSPTAGLISKGRIGCHMRLFPEGGVMAEVAAGALRRLTIGVSYGGERVIGDRKIDWFPRLEAAVRYRAVEEGQRWPALVIGYETQGFGPFTRERYQVKSKGLFLAMSKNYLSALGQFGVHAGANLSREDVDGDGDPSGWVGVDKEVNGDLQLVGEYDLALNDNADGPSGLDEGYLNAGVRWTVAPPLAIGVYLKNLLGRGPGQPDISRELSVLYTEEF